MADSPSLSQTSSVLGAFPPNLDFLRWLVLGSNSASAQPSDIEHPVRHNALPSVHFPTWSPCSICTL